MSKKKSYYYISTVYMYIRYCVVYSQPFVMAKNNRNISICAHTYPWT